MSTNDSSPNDPKIIRAASMREKWVSALRSGKYQQTSGALKFDGKYCCLGVLCRVKLPKSKTFAPFGDFGNLTERGCKLVMISEWDSRELACLNDSGISFDEISYIIEALPYEI